MTCIERAACVALLLCPISAHAQVAAVDSSQPLVVVQPASWPTSKVCLLVDRSGSMGGPELGRAIRAASYIAGMPVDELTVRLTVFDTTHQVWPGHRYAGDKTTPGWTVFPDMIAHNLALAWLATFPAAGGTDPTSALRDAMVQQVRGLTVILISDGIFEKDVTEELRALQQWRVQQGLGLATICAYGIGSNAKDCAVLRHLGTEFRGGFYVSQPKRRGL